MQSPICFYYFLYMRFPGSFFKIVLMQTLRSNTHSTFSKCKLTRTGVPNMFQPFIEISVYHLFIISDPYMVVGYISRRCDFSTFGFIVTQNNGKSTGSWSGQCHLCDGQEVLYTTWTHRLRVDTCTDNRKATR